MAAGADLYDVCEKIIGLDDSIRFAGIPNKFGKQIVVEYRKGLEPFLTDNESELYAIETVIRMNTRKDFESKLGKPIYSFTLYEKLKRATIALDNKDYPILMVSFDIEADHEAIILNKIIPFVNKQLAQ
ncbi:MAG TPA: hypothetical protein VKA95_17075 [Nitrososphaeraceae archaeon]|nr:hypothetical protein [Nitrososphaeraceae archaeon]